MFKFLKDKLKGAVDSFSKKTEEVEDVEVSEDEVVDVKETEDSENIEEVESKKEIKQEEKDEVTEEVKEDPVKEEIKEEPEVEPAEEPTVESDEKELQKIEEKVQGKEVSKEEPEQKEEKEIIEPKDEKVEEKPTEKTGFFGKILAKKIDEIKFEELFFELELGLLENNVSVEVIDKIKNDLKIEIVDKPIKRGKISEVIEDTLKRTIESIIKEGKIEFNKKPIIICMVGINGSGKTTTTAKLASKFSAEGKKVVLAAADTFRAAAIDQIQEHADKLNIKLIKHQYGSDAAAVAFDAIKHAESSGADIVIIDTAGRMHSNVNLMNEIQKVVKIATPDYVLFVGESITGNDCVEQAKKFDEMTKLDGVILTKADIDEKGGAALSISYVTGKPIFYLGMGQEYKDLEEFSKEKVMKNLGL